MTTYWHSRARQTLLPISGTPFTFWGSIWWELAKIRAARGAVPDTRSGYGVRIYSGILPEYDICHKAENMVTAPSMTQKE
jgi:hypothetical protein